MDMRVWACIGMGLLPMACDSAPVSSSSGGSGGGTSQGGSTGTTGGQSGSVDDAGTIDEVCPPDSQDAGVGAVTIDMLVSHFKRGINLGNRLDAPTEGDWGPVLHATDFSIVANRGFDHIRLPIRFSDHAGTAAPYTLNETFMARVDWAIAHALSNGLSVLVDMHHYDALFSDPTGHQARFVALWDQIARRYENCPESVAFELLNEPNSALDSEWNQILEQGLNAVRQTNPNRLVVIDGPTYAAASSINSLVLPGDPYIMSAVHAYEPSLFTFQGQDWMVGGWNMTTGVVYPGPPSTPITPVQAALNTPWANDWFERYNTLPSDQNPSGLSTIEGQAQTMQDYRTSSGHPIYNGEWGPHNGGDIDSRARYMKDMREACERRQIGWAVWEDQSGMQLFNADNGTWVEPITSALFP